MRILTGTITSNRMQKTVVVRVNRLRRHKKYGKFYRTSRTYQAAVGNERDYRIGDVVTIQETRPLSKLKRWRVVEVVKRTAVPEIEEAQALEAAPQP